MKINCHCHIFSLDCVPMEFRERFLLDIGNPVHRFVHRVVRRILPDESKMEDLLDFMDLSISDIAEKLVHEMDEAGIDLCTPLMMDMAYCEGFGGYTKSFEHQMGETAAAVDAINRKYDSIRMLPFIAADPRRYGIEKIVRNALGGGVFKGVKIYPVMGFSPNDRRLYPIYEYCEKREIPITAHCENGGIPGLRAYYHLADPGNWGEVLKNFPELILNLAHNDRTGSPWQKEIAGLITAYPHVYTDISYDTEMMVMPRRYFRHIKAMLATPGIRDRVLYGTDWYMGRCFWTESSYLKWFTEYARRLPWCRVTFTEDEIKKLTEDNPRSFLGLKLHS
jgi:predicted TIM-barrel fold metal-dependent hydrolase